MSKLITINQKLSLQEFKREIHDKTKIPMLRRKLDEAEKEKVEIPFAQFNDVEMLQWYLYRKEHLNKEHGKSPRTIEEYERELFLFIEQLLTFSREIDLDIVTFEEGSLFRSLSPRHIRRYQEWLAERSPYVMKKGRYSAATLSRKTTILRNFLLYMYEVKYIDEPLHTGLYKASVKTDDRPNRDLGPSEVVHLLNHFRSINHPIMFSMIHILTTTGIRNEEFCRLKVKDVQYDSITEGHYLDILGKGNKRRQVPLKEKTFKSILIFRKARGNHSIGGADPDEPLFCTNTGKAYTPSYLSQYLTKMILETKLSFVLKRSSFIGPHTFRHAFAIISYKSGVDVYEIMRSLGHEKIETTMIYLQKVMDKEQHAIYKWKADEFGDYI